MLKKLFVSAILLLAIMCFVVSLLKGNNNKEKSVTVSDRVAVIAVEGSIVCGPAVSNDNPFERNDSVTSGSIMKQLREAAEDKSVKAVLLRIDSGGGSATAAEEVGRELKRFKEKTKKPIVATMSNTGASAAYWIAVCSSDKVYANATTLTGSIGVYMPYMNVEELYKKIGITSDKIKSGPHKDIMSHDRTMTPEEKAIMQSMVNEIYEEFVAVVAAGRKMEEAKVRELADGRVYTGKQAKNLGLVDEIGNYYDALAAAGELGGIKPGKDGLPPVKKQEKAHPWEYLLGAEIAKTVKAEIVKQFNAELQPSMTVR